MIGNLSRWVLKLAVNRFATIPEFYHYIDIISIIRCSRTILSCSTVIRFLLFSRNISDHFVITKLLFKTFRINCCDRFRILVQNVFGMWEEYNNKTIITITFNEKCEYTFKLHFFDHKNPILQSDRIKNAKNLKKSKRKKKIIFTTKIYR